MTDRATPADPKPTKPRAHGSEKRKRQKYLRFRATVEECAEVEAKAAKSGLSVAGYLRALTFGKDTPQPRAAKRAPVDKQELVRLRGELGKVGGNINQIAHHLNQGKAFESGPFAVFYAKLDKILDDILAALGRGER